MNPENLKTNLDWALFYRSLDWSVFPVKVLPGEDGKMDKKPLVAWKRFQEILPTEAEIREMWTKYPEAGIGLATGKVSGLFVLDVDLGGDVSHIPNLNGTLSVRTGSGGYHYYFCYPGLKVRNSVKEVAPGCDIRGDGGFVVLPPTPYGDKGAYAWINAPGPILVMADAPLEIIQKVTEEDWQLIGNQVDEVMNGVEQGRRNDAGAVFIGKLLNETAPNLWESVAWPAFKEWNKRNNPPLPEKELALIFRSIAGIHRRNHPEITEMIDKKEIYIQLKKDFWIVDKKGKLHMNPMGLQTVAEYFVNNYHIKTMGGERFREIYIYDGGVYKPEGSSFFKSEIEDILEETWSTHWQGEIIEKIKNLSYIKRQDFIVSLDLINLKNGVYSLSCRELWPHSPDYLFLHQIPVAYDAGTTCPGIKKFLTDIFQEKDIPVIQEWFGFCLYRRYFIKKALILFGERNTGKTTFTNILKRFIGQNNFSEKQLQKLGSDKFAVACLYHKHLNICDDLSSSDINDNGTFKMLTGGGGIQAEKKYEDGFSFENYAKLAFCCNKIPAPKDTDDDAYFSRWILINLQKQFDNGVADKFLLDKLLTETEMSGLLNFALAGLQRLIVGDFSYNREVYEIKMEMLKSSSSVAEFAYEKIEKATDEWISKEELYQAYINFTEERGLAPEPMDGFGKHITKYAGYVLDGKKLIVNKQKTGWRNVRLKSMKNFDSLLENVF